MARPEGKHDAQRLAVAVARASGLTDSDSDFAGCPAAQRIAVFIRSFLRRNG